MPKHNCPQMKDARPPHQLLLALLAALICMMPVLAAHADPDLFDSASIPIYGYKTVQTYHHDPSAFTQGLVYDGGVLYEGTGEYGQSTLRRVSLETGNVLQQTKLANSLFGEGVAVWKDRLIQLTWQSGLGLVYGKENLTEIGRFSYRTEGWGITSNGLQLIMSDGTETLHFLDPETFQEQEKIEVKYNGTPVVGLNELEYIKGEIYANLWPTNWIAIISPETGDVLGAIDLGGILPKADVRGVDVLNGIAYDPEGDRLFVTGKLWPKLFQIELVARDRKE
jgi:glutaminyl-peptide cyclotransferase